MVAYLQDASDFQTFIFWGLAGKIKHSSPRSLLCCLNHRWLADCSPSITRSYIYIYNPYPSLYDGPWAEVEAVSLHHQCASWPWASAMVLGPKIQEKWSEKNWDLTLKMWEFVQICPSKMHEIILKWGLAIAFYRQESRHSPEKSRKRALRHGCF